VSASRSNRWQAPQVFAGAGAEDADDSVSRLCSPMRAARPSGLLCATSGAPRRIRLLPWHGSRSHASGTFCVTEAQAATIRTACEQRGDFSAAVELRQLFPGIRDNAQAPECPRTIASWRPLPKRLRPMRNT
jgi:hypothetical protein